MESINKRITYYREKAGYTKRQMAEKMGLKYTTYCRMENEGKIFVENLKILADVLDVDERVLLYGDFIEEFKYRKSLEENIRNFLCRTRLLP